jgi:recombination protein RecA
MARRKKEDAEVDKVSAVKEESKLQVKMGRETTAFYNQMAKLAPGAVATASSLTRDLPRISTGNFGLDVAMFGGLPQGRIVRFWGRPKSAKSGASLKAAATFQRNHCSDCFRRDCDCKGRSVPIVFYIDAENKMLDQLSWVERHGIILDAFKVMAPPSGQHIVDCVDMILRSPDVAKCGLIIVDSLAHVSSKDELTKLATDGPTVGRNAFLLNLAFRKWATAITNLGVENTRKPTIIAINQLREKVGVMYGCFHEDTPVMFADGSQVAIRDVVEKRLEGPVLSWDGDRVVERKISAWHDNGLLGDGEEWLTFRVRGTGGRRGAIGFTCTPNHVLVTGDGEEVAASTVRVGDELLSWYEATLTDGERAIITGSILGDGHLALVDGRDSAALLVLANSEQPEYLAWKLRQLRSLGFSKCEATRTSFRSTSSFELGLLRQEFYDLSNDADRRKIPEGAIRDAGLLTLAVWFMDDGHHREDHGDASISVKRLSHGDGHRVAAEFAARYPGAVYRENQKAIYLPTATFRLFSAAISSYVHPSMAYKLFRDHRTAALGHELSMVSVTRRLLVSAEVVGIHKSDRKMRSKRKYDLTIDENSFYMVGGDSRGVVVHNSPETMPGGKGQEYGTSLDVRFDAGGDAYIVWNEKKQKHEAKLKGYKSTFKPSPDMTPDFTLVNYRVSASAVCPRGRSGSFNYWLKTVHGHTPGDPDNGFQLWHYAKRYLLEQDGHTKKITGTALSARTLDELETAFRADMTAQRQVWPILMSSLCKDDHSVAGNDDTDELNEDE